MSEYSKKWDDRFLALAEHIAGWSKDPSTKCGAVIAKGNRIISLGFNGYPHGMIDSDLDKREEKLMKVIHAEVNAVLFARQDPAGATIYVWPMPPCCRCAAVIIQAGISRVVAQAPTPKRRFRWHEELLMAGKMFQEAGVPVERVQDVPKNSEETQA